MPTAERNGEHQVALAAVRLMLLTGFRISEAQGLQRDWLHADQGHVHFPDTKSDGQARWSTFPVCRRTARQEKTAKPRGPGRGGVTTGGEGVAARTVSTLQSLLAHANRLDVIPSNPAVGVRKLAGKKKERRLSVAEIKRLGETRGRHTPHPATYLRQRRW